MLGKAAPPALLALAAAPSSAGLQRLTVASAAGRRARLRPTAVDEEAGTGLRSYLIYLGVAFVLAVVLSLSYATTARLGYRIDDLKEQIAVLQAKNEKLSFELSGYQSVARVEKEATGRLGMVRPDYVRISSVVKTGEAGGPTAPDAAPDGAVAKVIRLTPAGADTGSGDALAAASGPGPGALASLWERFYQWLTGGSQAEAGSWQ